MNVDQLKHKGFLLEFNGRIESLMPPLLGFAELVCPFVRSLRNMYPGGPLASVGSHNVAGALVCRNQSQAT